MKSLHNKSYGDDYGALSLLTHSYSVLTSTLYQYNVCLLPSLFVKLPVLSFVYFSGKDSDDMEKPVCYQPTIVGECRGAFRRWTFDQRTKSCEEFVYGGCNGNDNRFNSPDECEETCNLQVVTQGIY